MFGVFGELFENCWCDLVEDGCCSVVGQLSVFGYFVYEVIFYYGMDRIVMIGGCVCDFEVVVVMQLVIG